MTIEPNIIAAALIGCALGAVLLVGLTWLVLSFIRSFFY